MKVVIDIDKGMYNYICKHYTGEDTACLAIKDGLVLPDNFLYPLQLTNEQILGIGDRYLKLKQERILEKQNCKDCIHYLGEEDHPCNRVDCNIVRMRIGIDGDNGENKE